MANKLTVQTRRIIKIGAPDPQGAPSNPPPVLPKGYRARCERCSLNFKTLDELSVHRLDQHNISRQRMPL